MYCSTNMAACTAVLIRLHALQYQQGCLHYVQISQISLAWTAVPIDRLGMHALLYLLRCSSLVDKSFLRDTYTYIYIDPLCMNTVPFVWKHWIQWQHVIDRIAEKIVSYFIPDRQRCIVCIQHFVLSYLYNISTWTATGSYFSDYAT